MKILFDLQAAQSAYRRGIGRYAMSSVKNILSKNKKHDIYILLNNDVDSDKIEILRELEGLIDRRNIYFFTSIKGIYALKTNNNHPAKIAELIYENLIEALQPDIIHIYCLFSNFHDDTISYISKDHNIPISVTLYDLIPYIMQEHYLTNNVIKDWYLEKYEQLKHADMLLAISDSSKQEAIKYLDFNSSNAINVTTDASNQFKPRDSNTEEINRLKDKFNIKNDFIAYTSFTDYRKNNINLFTAYSLLNNRIRKNCQLVIICNIDEITKNYYLSHCKSCGLHSDEVIFTDYITDDELILLYNICKLFVFPSLHEGFGLPVLEAMRCGAAVIGANKTSIPEIIGDSRFMFDPYSPQSIADKITQCLTDNDFYHEALTNSQKQQQNFSWEKVASNTVNALERLYKETKSSKQKKILTTENLLSDISKNKHAWKLTDSHLMLLAKSINENDRLIKSSNRKKQFFIDMSEFIKVDAKTGIPRVVKEITKRFTDTPPDKFVIRPVYCTDQGYYYAPKIIYDNLKIYFDKPDSLIDINKGDVFLGLDLCPNISDSAFDFLQFHSFRGLSIYFVIYDIILLKNTKYHGEEVASIFDRWLKNVATVADGLLAISKTVLNDTEQYLDTVYPDIIKKRPYRLKFDYFYLGSDFKIESKKIAATSKNKRVTFLMVGWIDPRKGHMDILKAMSILWNEDYDVDLVIVGRVNVNTQKILDHINEHSENGSKLHYLKQVDDEHLIELYSNSSALIAGSEDEGFGLPLIEAASYNLPILARDIAIFKEIAGDHAFYFRNEEPEIIAKDIIKWISLYKNDNHPKSGNLPFLTWDQSAEQLMHKIID